MIYGRMIHGRAYVNVNGAWFPLETLARFAR